MVIIDIVTKSAKFATGYLKSILVEYSDLPSVEPVVVLKIH